MPMPKSGIGQWSAKSSDLPAPQCPLLNSAVSALVNPKSQVHHLKIPCLTLKFRCIALHCIALRCTSLHFVALHCISLHFVAFHCTSLHFNETPCVAQCNATNIWLALRQRFSGKCGIGLPDVVDGSKKVLVTNASRFVLDQATPEYADS